jgi:hypothetical protein
VENEGRIMIDGKFPVPLPDVVEFIDNALHDAGFCGCSRKGEGDWYTMTCAPGFEDDADCPGRITAVSRIPGPGRP